MKLENILTSYLNNSQMRYTPLGGEKLSYDNQLENEIFVSRLRDNSRINNQLIYILIIFLSISFIGICFLITYFMPEKAVIFALLSGEGISIITIIRIIHNIYKIKVFTDHLLYLLPKIQSEEEKKLYIGALLEYIKSKRSLL